jgi:hypothetical protein
MVTQVISVLFKGRSAESIRDRFDPPSTIKLPMLLTVLTIETNVTVKVNYLALILNTANLTALVGVQT